MSSDKVEWNRLDRLSDTILRVRKTFALSLFFLHSLHKISGILAKLDG